MGKREMSLPGVPFATGGNLGVGLEQISSLPDPNISNTVKKRGRGGGWCVVGWVFGGGGGS